MVLSDYIVTEETSIIDVMKKIDQNASGNIFICSSDLLVAVVTDGDIRRSLMNNIDINTPIRRIANYKPIYLNAKESRRANDIMRKNVITALPLVDENMKIVNIKFLLKNLIFTENIINIPVVVMAGGKGTRLKPYTDILPKPLIPIGDKTITEHIMEHFEKYGCNRFQMIVNYKKNFIKSYFADIEKKRNILFIEEEKFLGTGGGLSLLQGKIEETFFLTNCDILIEADYGQLLKHHKDNNNIITIVCAKKNIIVPYGTVEIAKDGSVDKFIEKPSFEFNTSTGLYVIEPQFLDKIPADSYILITDIIQKCLEDGDKIGTYLIEEDNWMDMGQLEELEKMKEKMQL